MVLVPEFRTAPADLDAVWSQFETADDAVIDHLLPLRAHNEFFSTP